MIPWLDQAGEDRAPRQQVAEWPQVKPFSREGLAVMVEHIQTWRRRYLTRGQVNGVEVAVVESYSYDNDRQTFRCFDPEAAGLVRVEKYEPKDALEASFMAIFGEE